MSDYDPTYGGAIHISEFGFCPHGVNAHLYRCGKCPVDAYTIRREMKLYEMLEKLAAALDRFAERLP